MMPEGIPISETVQRKEKYMRGDIVVDGKKMTATELVELYLETKNDLDTANNLLKARKEEFDSLTMICIPSAVVDFKNHLFGNLVIIPNSKYEDLRNQIKELETELRVKEDLFKIKNAISKEPCEESRPSIEWYECEMMKGLEEISRQKAIINNLIETIYLLQME
jgi:hypothetical protein